MTAISILRYDPDKGRDVTDRYQIGYAPSIYKTKEQAAKALAEALRKWAAPLGWPADEIQCWPPERTEQYSGCKQWCVTWESGPFEWAIAMSMEIRGPWGYCEPYFSFDLHFTD